VTEGREGFIHATEMTGGSSEMTLKFILRDFERDGLAAKGDPAARSAPPFRRANPAPRSPAPSARNIATCATGWKRT
jgi:hypothetical protein